MSRGLGKIQKRVLEIIKNGEALSTYRISDHNKHLDIPGEIKTEVRDCIDGSHFYSHTIKGLTDVEYLMAYVVNGPNCWKRQDRAETDFYDPDFELKEATESERQSIWRSIRQLEKRGIIESYVFPIYIEGRWYRSNFIKGYENKQGCANRQKAICLVQRS